MRNPISLFLSLFLLVLLSASVSARATRAPVEDIQVVVVKHGDEVLVDATYLVPVAPAVAWAVLTDYERMAGFLPEMKSSRIVSRSENRLRVSQAGTTFFGPFPLFFEYLRDIELLPQREIRSIVVGGSLKRGIVITSLAAHGSGTRVVYRSRAVPDLWLPFGLGAGFIRTKVEAQIQALRNEMIRRAAMQGARSEQRADVVR